jgi:hypothetical protein
VADNERYSPDHPTGLPRVSPETIRASKGRPLNLDAIYNRLKRDNPDLAFELATGLPGIDPDHMRLKRAFAEGALWLYYMLTTAADTNNLETMFNTPTIDGDDGEDRPLSV